MLVEVYTQMHETTKSIISYFTLSLVNGTVFCIEYVDIIIRRGSSTTYFLALIQSTINL